jgi:hypothetical protein
MTIVLRIVGWTWVALSILVLFCFFWITEAKTLIAITTVSIAALSPGFVAIAVAHFLDWKRLRGYRRFATR